MREESSRSTVVSAYEAWFGEELTEESASKWESMDLPPDQAEDLSIHMADALGEMSFPIWEPGETRPLALYGEEEVRLRLFLADRVVVPMPESLLDLARMAPLVRDETILVLPYTASDLHTMGMMSVILDPGLRGVAGAFVPESERISMQEIVEDTDSTLEPTLDVLASLELLMDFPGPVDPEQDGTKRISAREAVSIFNENRWLLAWSDFHIMYGLRALIWGINALRFEADDRFRAQLGDGSQLLLATGALAELAEETSEMQDAASSEGEPDPYSEEIGERFFSAVMSFNYGDKHDSSLYTLEKLWMFETFDLGELDFKEVIAVRQSDDAFASWRKSVRRAMALVEQILDGDEEWVARARIIIADETRSERKRLESHVRTSAVLKQSVVGMRTFALSGLGAAAEWKGGGNPLAAWSAGAAFGSASVDLVSRYLNLLRHRRVDKALLTHYRCFSGEQS